MANLLGAVHINPQAYMKASLAARRYAKIKGISPIKTTKALSEATRNAIDYAEFSGSAGSADITRGLTGLTDRLTTGNRARRTAGGGAWYTPKGAMVDNFGKYLANEVVHPNSYPVLRPKPANVFARTRAAKYGPRG